MERGEAFSMGYNAKSESELCGLVYNAIAGSKSLSRARQYIQGYITKTNRELLEAARDVVADCDCPVGVEGQHRMGCERLRAAIAKAEGKQS
jgi:hypothetical protein